jgi:hypothetical protein
MGINYPQRMSAGLRWAIFMTFGALWVSGCHWLVLHYFFTRPSDFGPLQHPWAPLVLRVHGWLAVGSVFLLGWITSRHVNDRWPQMIKRASGLAMASVAAALALTGYALYYTTDRLHDVAAVAHEVVGATAFLFALTHFRRHRVRQQMATRRQRSDASENVA